MTEGYDSLVDKLMACDGYDREEAEVLAVARLTAGEKTALRVGRVAESGADIRALSPPARPSSPAVSCVCGDPGDCQEDCQ